MILYTWDLLDVTCQNEQISHARYQVTANDGENTVVTEGNAYGDFSKDIPYKDITKQNIIDAVKKLYVQNEVNLIELNLENQLKNLKEASDLPPWHVETFKVEV